MTAVQTQNLTNAQNMLNVLLEKKAERFHQIKAEQEALKAEREALREELLKVMKEGNLNELQLGEYKMIFSEYDKTSFDEKAFKEADPNGYKRWVKKNEELKKQYVKTTHVEMFDVH